MGGRGGVLVGGFLNLNRWNSWEGVGDGRDISDGSLVTWGGIRAARVATPLKTGSHWLVAGKGRTFSMII